jgi:DNA-binding GntR family transcriptional regulator
MPKLATIKQPESLAKMAYQAIRHSILSGQWQPSELYNEKAIAADLGISRTPVREALLELASKDLIIFMPRRGLRLNRFTHHDVDEIFELRKAIELASVEKIANTSPLPDLLAIEESLLNQRKAVQQKNYMAFMEADRTFHTSFSTLTKNKRMISIVENIRDMIQVMGIKALSLEGRAVTVIEEHQAIFKAVKERNAQTARSVMAYHLDQSMEAVKESEL